MKSIDDETKCVTYIKVWTVRGAFYMIGTVMT